MNDGARGAPEDGPEVTVVREFGSAAGRLVTALASAAGGDEATALACVFALDEAFGQLTSALAVLPEVLTRGDAGSRAETRLQQRRTALAAVTAEIAGLRTSLTALDEVDRHIRESEVERARLAAKLAELEQASTWAEELAALRERIATLEVTVNSTPSHDDLGVRLSGALAQLGELTRQQRAALGPELERAIADVTAAGEDLAAKQGRKAELDADFERLATESDAVAKGIQRDLPSLAEWRKADAAMADALADAGAPDFGGTLDRLRDALADLADQMTSIERHLGPVFTAYCQARDEALAIRSLGTPAS